MKKKMWVALPLVVLLIVLSGCQAVGGFDVKNAMLRNLDIQSSDSSQTLSVKLTPSETATAEDMQLITIVNSSKLVIDSAKMQSMNVISVTGAVEYMGQRLPFQLYMDQKGMTIDLEGAKQPIYISFDMDQQLGGLSANLNMGALREQQMEFAKSVGSFLFTHLPNPNQISVDSVNEDVYGESLDLTRLHIEFTGQEAVQLIKPFLTSVAADEQGMKELIGAFYDYFSPLLNQVDPSVNAADTIGSREEFVNTGYTEISSMLNEFLANYDKQIGELQQDEDFNTILGPNTRVVSDVYVDKDLYTRKQTLDVTVALPKDEYTPFTSIHLHSDSQIWDINRNVTADQIDTSRGLLTVSSDTTPGTILRNFESTSQMAMLLNLADITNKVMYVDEYSDYDTITRNKLTFITAKDLAEQFDADLNWNAATKQLTLTDDITGAVTVLTVGSKQATVDGEARTLPAAVTQVNGKTYVPLRAVAGILNATVTSSNGMIIVERK